MKKIIILTIGFAGPLNAVGPQKKPVLYLQEVTDLLARHLHNSSNFTRRQLIQNVKSSLEQGANPNGIGRIFNPPPPWQNPEDYPVQEIDLDFQEIRPLEKAVELNIPEVVELLLNAGANPNIRSSTTNLPILAQTLNNTAIAKLLIDHGANTTETLTHINRAIGTPENLVAMNFLIRHGADVNDYGIFNSTPLAKATEAGNKPKMRLLLAAGADPNLTSKDYTYTPLMEAVVNKDINAIQLLLENGAKTDITNNFGQTALDMAIRGGASHEIKTLLRNPPPVKKLGLKKLP